MLKGVNDAVGLSVDCKKITMRTKKKVGETPTSFTL